MMTSHRTEGGLPGDPVDPVWHHSVQGPGWLEARIPAVFAAVLVTGIMIAAWNLVR